MTDQPDPVIDERFLPGSTFIYDMAGNNPNGWYASVELLAQAAKRVRYESVPAGLPGGEEGMFSINAVYAMLLGYAIECALKGLWVKAGNAIAKDGKLVRIRGVGNHQIGQLLRKVQEGTNLGVSDLELNVLDRISAFVLFAGRYPIPTTAAEMKAQRVPTGGTQAPGFFTQDDFRVAEMLLNRFKTALTPWLGNSVRVITEPPAL
jgi:hypothetical protein